MNDIFSTGFFLKKEIKDNIISDNTLSMPYGKIDGLTELIELFFIKKRIHLKKEFFLFKSSNSIFDILIITYFIRKKVNFIILNKHHKTNEKILKFCSYILEIKSEEVEKDIDNPDTYLSIIKNDKCIKHPNLENDINIFFVSSGSTEEPKIVSHNHNIIYNALNCANHFKFDYRDKIFIPVPISHMFGFGAALLPSLLKGASIKLLDNANIISYIEQEREFNPNITFISPGLCEMMMRMKKEKYKYKFIIIAGDKISKKVFEDSEKKFGKIINLYGSTELGVIATSDLQADICSRSDGIVFPLNDVKIRFKNQLLEKSNIEDISELYCCHKYSFDYYLDYDERYKTFTKKFCDEWQDTYDVGRLTDYNMKSFIVSGRSDYCVNRNGMLVALAEIEYVIKNQLLCINDIAVIPSDEVEFHGKQIIMFCSLLNKNVTETSESLRKKCFDILEKHKVPDKIIIKEELPKLPNGKIDRRSLTTQNETNQL
jgi:acyl-coenzyme A synthetase/AMP-(fatty) acid ligase